MNYTNFLSRVRGSRPLAKPGRGNKSVPASAAAQVKAALKPGLLKALVPVAAAAVVSLTSAAPAEAATLSPTFDYYFYPFITDGGTRTAAGNFGTFSAGFDERDAQFFLQFDTASVAAPGLALSSYHILSATLTLYSAANPGATYDNTYDPITTYNNGPVADADAGRPMELYGAGYRNGFTSSTVNQGMSFSTQAVGFPPNGTAAGIRSIFATDAFGSTSTSVSRDVSSNVTGGFDPVVFSIGQIAGLASGSTIPLNSAVTFTLDLNQPSVVNYLQMSLQDGLLGLVASSLSPASQTNSAPFPTYFTADYVLPAFRPTLTLTVETIPEPGAVTMVLCGLAIFAATWRGGQALSRLRGGGGDV